ncbi:unnamed protein product [Prorocentrum cordatum]|uniref:Uncharacterized protein n=1 Tax=Prorocentrum cordatum TaxID=2364126 RepID=A0ABN9V6Q4_9DINO|nr:unnamed protein product [Polarella glacialis]
MYRLARLPKHGSEHRPRPPTPTRREHQPAGQESDWTHGQEKAEPEALDAHAEGRRRLPITEERRAATCSGCFLSHLRLGPRRSAKQRVKKRPPAGQAHECEQPALSPKLAAARRVSGPSAKRDYCAQARTPHAGAAGAARLGIRGPGSRHDSNKLSESVDRVAGGGPGRDARQRGRGGGGGGEGTRAQTAAAAEAPLRGHLPRSPTGGRGRRQCIVTPLGHHHVETLGKEEV